jgi:hypothetical protein
MPQGLDRIESGGATGGEIAEDDPNGSREEKGGQDDGPIEDEGHLE